MFKHFLKIKISDEWREKESPSLVRELIYKWL